MHVICVNVSMAYSYFIQAMPSGSFLCLIDRYMQSIFSIKSICAVPF